MIVKDTNINEHNGSFTDWRLTLWGECIDPSHQALLPMPTEEDDDDSETISATPTYISIGPGETEVATPSANPTDHQHRPINAKPTAVPSSTSENAGMTNLPENSGSAKEPETGVKEHFLPHYFPTFGVSKRTQVWIYGALACIVLFGAGLTIYFTIMRKRRRRAEREGYEFEMLDDDDLLNKNSSGKPLRRRAGELYDAFAGESDEDQLLSEDEETEEAYQDQ